MSAVDPDVAKLREKIQAAQDEFDLAVVFHAVWKPAAYDTQLHGRLGTSYATQAFRVVSTALRREMLMALMRVWDESGRAVQIQQVARVVADRKVLDALLAERMGRVDIKGAEGAFREALQERADLIARIAAKYRRGGSGWQMFEKLKTLRDERLAHRQVTPAAATGPDIPDQEIEELFEDSSKLIQALLSVVNAHAYDPGDTVGVFGYYARHFWSSVRGERAEDRAGDWRTASKPSG